MKYSNSIEYNISTKFDSSGITKLKSELAQVELKLQNMGNKNQLFKFDEYRAQIQGLGDALTEAFNPSLGIINLQQFKTALKENQVTAQGLRDAFKAAGADGQVAFNNLIGQIGRLDTGIKRTSSAVDKMFVTFSNTFRWGLVSSFWSQFLNAIHSSVEYTKQLDDSLTQIMLVTDYNRESMNEYAKAANEAAKAVGQTTVGMTNASLIFAQQGYDLNQSQQLATLSAKLANASQQDTAATSDQITAYMNAYGLQDDMEALSQAMDNWARIANISAADVEEIALASQRAASMANAVGVSGEALAAQIATIESVTREAPEQIGNGLKTLYARFSDLKLGKDDEDGIGLGKVTSTLQAIGVQVLDAFGNVRDMDDIMEDLMVVWEDLDDTSKTAAAQALAGKHQVNRFMALMENSDMYREYLGETGANATGTLEQMNAEYLDSLQGRMTKLQSTLEGLFNDVFTTDAVYPVVDSLTKLAEAIDVLFKSVGGGPTVILGLASAFTKLFSNAIARSITDSNLNNALQKQRAINFEDKESTLTYLGATNPNPNNANSQAILNYAQQINSMGNSFNAEQMNRFNEILQEMVTNANAATRADEELKIALEGLNTVSNIIFGQGTESFIDEAGAVNAANLIESLQGKTEAFKNSLSFIKTAEQDFGGFSTNLTELLQKIQYGLEGNEVEFEKYKDNIEDLRFALNLLKTALPQDKVKELSLLLNEAEVTTGDWATDGLPKLINQLKGAQLDIDKIVEGLKEFVAANKDLTPEALEKYLEKLEQLAVKSKIAQGAAGHSNNLGAATIDVAKQQQNTKSIIDMVSAIGQLTFAWQSLSNLPSIWRNEDLNTSEKLLQTITNLTMVLPTLAMSLKKITGINSFKDMYETFSGTMGATKRYKQALDELNQAKNRAQLASEALNKAQKRLNDAEEQGEKNTRRLGGLKGQVTKAKKEEAAATEVLTGAEEKEVIAAKEVARAEQAKALAFKLGAMAIVAAIMAIITIVSQYNETLKETAKNSVEAFNNDYEKTQVNTSQFDELYSKYKETGIASDELTKAGKDLAQQLGIVGGSALAASGNFEQLAIEIRDAKKAAEEQMQLDSVLALQNLNASANSLFGNSSPWLNVGMDYNQWEDLSITEKRGAVNQRLVEVQEELNEALERQKELENAGQSDTDEARNIDIRINSLRRLQSTLQEISNADYFEGLDDIVQTMADSTISKLSESDFSGQTSTEIMQALLDPTGDYEWVARQYEILGEEAGRKFLAGLMSQLDPKNANLYSLLAGDFSILGDEETSIDITGLTPEMMQQFGYEDYDAFVAALQEKAAQGITLTPEINIESRYDFDSDEEINKYLEDYTDIDRDTLEMSTSLRMEEYAPEGNRFTSYDTSEQERNLAQARQNVADTVGAGNEAESAAQKELTDAQKEYDEALQDTTHDAEQYEKAMRKSAAAAARMVKTLDDMNDHFDDNREILEDGNKSTIDYAEALVQTKEDLAGLLDIDPSMLSNEFASSSEALDAMNTMLHGTQEEAEAAYETLRQLAAEDVINNLDIPAEITTPDGTTFTADYVRGTLNEMIASLDSQDLTLGMEADIDTEEWYARVNELLASGALTADQLTQVLSAAGYKGELRYEKGEGWTTETTYEVRASGSQTVGEGESAMSWPTEITMVPHYKTVWGHDVDIPVLEGATQTGGFVNQGGGGHQSDGGRGGGGGGCFIAGTLISLQNQFKNIEDIQIGDIVLSYNEEIHQNEYSIVLQTMIHNVTEEIYDLYIENEILTVTGIHRFYIRRKHDVEWIPASDLHIGDYVLFADGNWHPIFKIKVRIRSLFVYNFEVSHNHNYYVGRNQILAHNKGGKGGGGGKAKTIEPKEKKEHKKDFYEEVESQLEKVQEELSGIQKEEDRLIGDKARANQAKQIQLLNKEVDLQEKKMDILKNQEMPYLADQLEKEYSDAAKIVKEYGLNLTIPEPKYDEDGIISNYEQISAEIDKVHNALIDKYNAAAAAGNEDLTKTIDKAISKFDKEGEAILSSAQTYNDKQKEIIALQNEIDNLIDSIEDLKIEVYQASMDAIDNLKDLNKEFAEFQGFLTGLPTDSPFRDLTKDLTELKTNFEVTEKEAKDFYNEIIAEKKKALAATKDATEKAAIQSTIDYLEGLRDSITKDNLNNGLLGLALTDLEELRKWYENPSLSDNPFGENTAALKEAYEDALKRAIDLTNDWQELQEDIVDNVIDSYDEINDKQERQMEEYEHIANQLEYLMDIYALSYGDESYKALSDIGKQQAEVLKQQLGQQVAIYNYWSQQYAAALETGNEQLANEIKDRMRDAEEAMQDLAEESAEAFVKAYENAVDAAVQKMFNETIGEDNLDHLNRNWEWDKKIVENYKDEVEKTFEIEKLRGKYNDLLNDAQDASLGTQNKIRKQMQEQLKLLEKQESMSEYDVELANSKLLILQKELALEDAQRNKNQMQLRRDTQGNYRYVYRADQNEISKARQEYLQAVQDAYELTKQQRIKTAEELAKTLEDFAKEWADLQKNMNLSEEERHQQSEELTEKFIDTMKHYYEDLKDSEVGMADVLGFMVENGTEDIAKIAGNMLNDLFDEQGNLIEDTDIAWWDFGNDLAKKIMPYIEGTTTSMNEQIYDEAKELRDNLTGENGVFPQITDAITGEDGYVGALNNANTATEALNDATSALADQIKDLTEKELTGKDGALDTIKKYNTTLDDTIGRLQKLNEDYQTLRKTMAEDLNPNVPGKIPEAEKKADEKSSSTKTSSNNTTTTIKPTNNNKVSEAKAVAAYNWINGGRRGSNSFTKKELAAGQDLINLIYPTSLGGAGWSWDRALKYVLAKSYDTGGYTGEWGKDGKLAVLHQKELVLNAEDTQNILSAVNLVRQLSSTLSANLSGLSAGGFKSSLLDSALGGVEQRVEIKAEFPNVRDSFEIETALTNLADKAYQYAHRNI